MSAISNYLEDALINATLRGQTYTGSATVWLALYTTPTDDASGGTEVPATPGPAGTSYVRTQVTFAAPTDGASSNTAVVNFPASTASWGTVTHFAIMDAQTAGNRLYHGALGVAKTVDQGDVFTVPAGNLTITLQ
jgi:hypothetical protein